MNAPDVVLIDAGPLVALADMADDMHQACRKTLSRLPGKTRLVSIMPVVTEAFYLLSAVPLGAEKCFDLLERLQLSCIDVTRAHMARARVLMKQYADLPMDFADACLVATAEALDARTIFTLDKRDFRIYCPKHVRGFSLLP